MTLEAEHGWPSSVVPSEPLWLLPTCQVPMGGHAGGGSTLPPPSRPLPLEAVSPPLGLRPLVTDSTQPACGRPRTAQVHPTQPRCAPHSPGAPRTAQVRPTQPRCAPHSPGAPCTARALPPGPRRLLLPATASSCPRWAGVPASGSMKQSPAGVLLEQLFLEGLGSGGGGAACGLPIKLWGVITHF